MRAKVMAICEKCGEKWLQRKDHWKKLEKEGIPHLCKSCSCIKRKAVNINMLKEYDKAYIAGYLEADGCISWSGPQPQISIATADEEMIEYFLKTVGGGRRRFVWLKNLNHRNQRRWMLNGHYNCAFFCEQLLPYMKMERKKQRARKVIKNASP